MKVCNFLLGIVAKFASYFLYELEYEILLKYTMHIPQPLLWYLHQPLNLPGLLSQTNCL